MITLLPNARRPVIVADATADDVTVQLTGTEFSVPFLGVIRVDASGNTVTVKNPDTSTVCTLAVGESVILSPQSAGLWAVMSEGGIAGGGGGITALTGDVTASGSGSVPATLATAQPAVHTWALAQTFTVAPVFTDQSGTRTALGLGTLATQSGTFSGTHSGTSSGTNTGDQTNITGNAATVTTNANLTGPVTSVGNATTITNDAVTNAMLANMATATFKGRNSGTTGDPEDLTVTQMRALLGIVSRGFIDGLTLTFNSTTTWNISAGTVRDSTNVHNILLAASTKILQSSGAWAAGTGANGLDTGARAASTWYHVWAICKADGTSPDILFSLSATAPTMPATWTLKAGPIASFKTDAGALVFDQFKQDGDTFILKAPINDIDATNPGTSAVTRTMSTPTGIRTQGIFGVGFATSSVAGNPSGVIITDLSITDTGPSAIINSVVLYSATVILNNAMLQTLCFTNTSAQVRSRVQISVAATRLILCTYGWVHPRGKIN